MPATPHRSPKTRCPDCGSLHSDVIDTRGRAADRVRPDRVVRTRCCRECERHYRTIELPLAIFDELARLAKANSLYGPTLSDNAASFLSR